MAAALTLQEVLLEGGERQQWQNLPAQGHPFSSVPPLTPVAHAQTLDPRPLRPQTWQNLQRRQHQVS